jgi:hypothetical protein
MKKTSLNIDSCHHNKKAAKEILLASSSQLVQHEYQGHPLHIEIDVSKDFPPNISIYSEQPLPEDLIKLLTGPLPPEGDMVESQKLAFLIRDYAKTKDLGNVGSKKVPTYQLYIVSENEDRLEPFINSVVIPLIELRILPPNLLEAGTGIPAS